MKNYFDKCTECEASERTMEQEHQMHDREQLEEEETVGVRLPVIKIGISVLAVILSGIFPGILLVLLYAQFIQALPPGPASSILIIMTLPLLFWIVYFVYMLTAVLVTKLFLAYYHARCEPCAESLNRQFHDESHPDYKKVHYYHMRGAIIKFTVWVTQKFPFPAFNQRVMQFYGLNKIGKRVMYEVCGVGMEFCSIGNDVILEVGSALSSHLVDELYGTIIIAPVKIEDGVTIGVNTPIGPGSVVKKGFHLGDNCMTFKKWPLKREEGREGTFFLGNPGNHSDIRVMIADDELKHDVLKFQ